MLTNLKSTSPMPVMICSKSVPICNHFHAVRANSSRMTSFWAGVSHFDALVRGKPHHPGARIFFVKN